MNSQPMNGNPDNFDSHIRRHHAAALAQLSPQVQAQLAQRRNAALRGQPVRRSHGLRYAAASVATVCAMAIGLRMYALPTPVAAPLASTHVDAPVAAHASAAALTASAGAAPASSNPMLEEDPSFYAWLGTSDAHPLAME